MAPTSPAQTLQQLIDNIERVIVGKREVIELVVVGVLAEGHVLIEDIPGLGKTTLARALAKSVQGDFKRLQFTPDLLPSDVTGVSFFNQKTQDFEFHPGPIFANIVLADEINRTTPRTQSALLECMQEGQVTVDGMLLPLPKPFFVIATENPIEFQGTYPLPEAQVDRFLMKVDVGYPGRAQEAEIVKRQFKQHPIEELRPAIELTELKRLQQLTSEIHLKDELVNYIVELVDATRHHPEVKLGVSPRGSIALMRAARALALIAGRDYVTPNDIKRLAYPVLGHRLQLQPTAGVRGLTSKDLISQLLSSVPVLAPL